MIDALSIVMRYLHVVSAVVAVGGMAFLLLCLSPAMRLLEEKSREALLDAVHCRFQRVVWACIAGLIVSGIFNWMMLAGAYKAMGPMGNALIGIKVLLAAIVFGVVWARSAGFLSKASRRRTLMINIHLAAVVILLGSVLRHHRQAQWATERQALRAQVTQGAQDAPLRLAPDRPIQGR